MTKQVNEFLKDLKRIMEKHKISYIGVNAVACGGITQTMFYSFYIAPESRQDTYFIQDCHHLAPWKIDYLLKEENKK